MPLVVNLRHLESHNLVLKGEVPAAELDFDERDEIIRLTQPLHHLIEVQKLDQSLLLRGWLDLWLDCQCVRCLKPFKHHLKLESWVRLVSLQGEEAASVSNDCVDLTPYVREDILLAIPQHPLCSPQCQGLSKGQAAGNKPNSNGRGRNDEVSSAWAELDKLKF